MKNAVIVHGWGGNSQGNWFPWLANELRKKSFEVTVPDFPDSYYPDLSTWLDFFKNTVKVDNNTILIGHSLGVAFILRFLEQLEDKKIKAAYLVAGFDKSLGIEEIENFVNKPFDFEKIKTVCNSFTVINSDDDPYIPLHIGKELAENLDTKLIIENNGNHLQNPSGLFSYPELLEKILDSRSSPE